jgi:uncharacterized surface protein with fasciclin (FAS1) repeats
MFKIKFLCLAAFASISLFSFNSCTEGLLGEREPKNVLDILKKDQDYSIFSELHERLNYIGTGGTVFAPNDDAFEEYFNAGGLSFDNMTERDLEILMNYHYLREALTKEELTIGYNDTEAMYSDYVSSAILIERNSDGVRLNRFVTAIETDIEADEAVFYTINKVLVPLTSMGLARLENLDSFVVAMDRVDAFSGIYSVIEKNRTYSIVAPDNSAFVEGLANNGWNSISDVPIVILEQAMKEHIFLENLRFENRTSENMYSMNGTNASYDERYTSISDYPAYNAKITQFELQGVNGTLMITDEVFLF